MTRRPRAKKPSRRRWRRWGCRCTSRWAVVSDRAVHTAKGWKRPIRRNKRSISMPAIRARGKKAAWRKMDYADGHVNDLALQAIGPLHLLSRSPDRHGGGAEIMFRFGSDDGLIVRPMSRSPTTPPAPRLLMRSSCAAAESRAKLFAAQSEQRDRRLGLLFRRQHPAKIRRQAESAAQPRFSARGRSRLL